MLAGPPGSACRLPGSQGGAFLLRWTQVFHRRAPSTILPVLPSTQGLVFRLAMSSQIRLKKHSFVVNKHFKYTVIYITMFGHLIFSQVEL